MDKLKLDIRSMDDLHAELKVNQWPFQQQVMISQDLAEALSRLSLLPVDWQGRAKLVSWLDTLSTMQVLLLTRLISLILLIFAGQRRAGRVASQTAELRPWVGLQRLQQDPPLFMRHRLTICIILSKTVSSYISSLPGPQAEYCSKTWCSTCSELPMLLKRYMGDSKELELLHNIYPPAMISGIE